MTEIDVLDDFSRVYRHDAVVNFIKGLMEGNIKFIQPPNIASVNTYSDIYKNIASDIEQYLSGKIKGDDLDRLESQIFR